MTVTKVNSVPIDQAGFLKVLRRQITVFGILAGGAAFGVYPVPMALSQTQADELAASTIDPVLVFNRVCYSRVPNIEAIREMATRFAWEKMGGEDLQGFTTWENPDVLEGWDVPLSGRIYRLGVVKAVPTDEMKQEFPEFSGGSAIACTLVLDGEDDADIINNRMTTLAGKEPSRKDISEGELTTQLWAGGNDELKVFLFAKSDKNNKASLLSVTILSKQ